MYCMYRTILLPLDGSDESEKALAQVTRLLQLQKEGGVLHILRVLELGTGWSSASVIRAQAEEKAVVDEYLEGLSLEMPSGWEVEKVHRSEASPAQAIAGYAEEVGADLIVMTCHGRSSLSQFILGSQTERTLQLAKCSVLVVR